MNKLVCLILVLFCCLTCQAQSVQDETANLLPKIIPIIKTNTNYNYESTIKIPIVIKPIENIKSELEINEGQSIQFKVVRDVFYNDKLIIKRGAPIFAKVSVIITPGMNGIPASIILKDFETKALNTGKLTPEYEIFGQDRSLFVFPLKWALTPLPPTGSLTNFIMGGHAKLKMKKHLTIYYYPEW